MKRLAGVLVIFSRKLRAQKKIILLQRILFLSFFILIFKLLGGAALFFYLTLVSTSGGFYKLLRGLLNKSAYINFWLRAPHESDTVIVLGAKYLDFRFFSVLYRILQRPDVLKTQTLRYLLTLLPLIFCVYILNLPFWLLKLGLSYIVSPDIGFKLFFYNYLTTLGLPYQSALVEIWDGRIYVNGKFSWVFVDFCRFCRSSGVDLQDAQVQKALLATLGEVRNIISQSSACQVDFVIPENPKIGDKPLLKPHPGVGLNVFGDIEKGYLHATSNVPAHISKNLIGPSPENLKTAYAENPGSVLNPDKNYIIDLSRAPKHAEGGTWAATLFAASKDPNSTESIKNIQFNKSSQYTLNKSEDEISNFLIKYGKIKDENDFKFCCSQLMKYAAAPEIYTEFLVHAGSDKLRVFLNTAFGEDSN